MFVKSILQKEIRTFGSLICVPCFLSGYKVFFLGITFVYNMSGSVSFSPWYDCFFDV